MTSWRIRKVREYLGSVHLEICQGFHKRKKKQKGRKAAKAVGNAAVI